MTFTSGFYSGGAGGMSSIEVEGKANCERIGEEWKESLSPRIKISGHNSFLCVRKHIKESN